MKDIAIFWDRERQRGDWAVAGGALVIGQDLETAVLISLFTDRVIPRDQLPPDRSTDRRGWWPDSYESSPIGSRLWTLRRKIKSNPTSLLQEATDICKEALEWLLEDKVAATVAVQCVWATPVQMVIVVVITEPDGTVTRFQYQWAWNLQGNKAPGPLGGPVYALDDDGDIILTDGGQPVLL